MRALPLPEQQEKTVCIQQIQTVLFRFRPEWGPFFPAGPYSA